MAYLKHTFKGLHYLTAQSLFVKLIYKYLLTLKLVVMEAYLLSAVSGFPIR